MTKRIFSMLLIICMIISMVPTVFAADTDVATIGETGYSTLQEAINDAVDGDIITLTADCAETVTVTQAPNVKITIDGDNHEMTGAIIVDGKSQRYETAGLTIKNVKFDTTNITKDASINLGGNNNIRYTSNVTVEDCSFTGTYNSNGAEKVGIKQYTGGCHNLVVKDCTVTGMHSLMQLKNVEKGLTISGCEITDSKSAIAIGQSTGVKIENCDIDVSNYGIRADGLGEYTATVKDCTINAKLPIVVRKTTAMYTLTLEGANTLTASNGDGEQVIFTKGDDDAPFVEPEVEVNFTDNSISGIGDHDKELTSFNIFLMLMLKRTFPIATEVTEGGEITFEGDFATTDEGYAKVRFKQDITYTITPDEGYAISDVIVDGESMGAISEYTFENVSKKHTISVVFTEIPAEEE